MTSQNVFCKGLLENSCQISPTLLLNEIYLLISSFIIGRASHFAGCSTEEQEDMTFLLFCASSYNNCRPVRFQLNDLDHFAANVHYVSSFFILLPLKKDSLVLCCLGSSVIYNNNDIRYNCKQEIC